MKIKKIVATALASTMLMAMSVPAFASMETPNLMDQRMQVQQMSNDEFDAYVMEYIHQGEKNGKSFLDIQGELNEIGIEIEKGANEAMPVTSEGDYTLTVYATKKSGSVDYSIISAVDFHATEFRPAYADALSVEWNPNDLDYYSYAVGDYVSLRDYDMRDQGVMVFNVDDNYVKAGSYTYASVHVVPKDYNFGTWTDIASKFIHTFNSTEFTWSGTGNLGYESGLAGGLTFTLEGASSAGMLSPISYLNSFKI